MKQFLLNHLKNIPGWKTKRKLVVISVDDYGNVRVDSKEARERMTMAGLKIFNRFDALDSLENRNDLEALFEVLSSVKDKNGHPAVFSAFALPCNIDFEKMTENDFSEYKYELLPETYEKLSAYYPDSYGGAWDLWKEGIRKKLIVPKFHGREHFNLKVFEEKLKVRDFEVLTALKNRSYTSISGSGYPTISVMAAFQFWDFEENKRFKEIIEDGLNRFEEVFGFRARHANAPGGAEHKTIHRYFRENGILFLDSHLIKREHQGRNKWKKDWNYTGKENDLGMIFQVRNVVFEPSVEDRDWVAYSLKQIEAAFRLKKPAIISSHRVNFCGNIDEENRRKSLEKLKLLLNQIVLRWPEAEFLSSDKLGEEMMKDKKNN